MAPPSALWHKGAELLHHATESYFGKPDPPAISERTAVLCALLYTLFYVAPFYLSSTLRATALHSRDAPTLIRARVRAVILTSLLSTVVTLYLLVAVGKSSPARVLRLLALYPANPVDCLRVLALLCLLFVAPLYETLIVDAAWRDANPAYLKRTIWDSWPGYRNYLFGPWAEELVFRSLVVSLYLLARVSPARIVITSPLIFGAAHAHHYIEFVRARTPPGTAFPPLRVLLLGLVPTAFQFAYTSLFGAFAAFVYLRTGSVWTAGVAHMFCNFMGLPRVWGRVGCLPDGLLYDAPSDIPLHAKPGPSAQFGEGSGVTKEKDDARPLRVELTHARPGKLSVGWTVVYYLLLPVGAYAFYRFLWPLTESENRLVDFGSASR